MKPNQNLYNIGDKVTYKHHEWSNQKLQGEITKVTDIVYHLGWETLFRQDIKNDVINVHGEQECIDMGEKIVAEANWKHFCRYRYSIRRIINGQLRNVHIMVEEVNIIEKQK